MARHYNPRNGYDKMAERRVSNTLIRKLLGEAGFLQQGQEIQHADRTLTNWVRHTRTLTLTEYKDAREPILAKYPTGDIVDPFSLGVRNPNLEASPTRHEDAP